MSGSRKRSGRKREEKQVSGTSINIKYSHCCNLLTYLFIYKICIVLAPVVSSHDHSLPQVSLVNEDPQRSIAGQTPFFTKELPMTCEAIAQPIPVTNLVSNQPERATTEHDRQINGVGRDR